MDGSDMLVEIASKRTERTKRKKALTKEKEEGKMTKVRPANALEAETAALAALCLQLDQIWKKPKLPAGPLNFDPRKALAGKRTRCALVCLFVCALIIISIVHAISYIVAAQLVVSNNGKSSLDHCVALSSPPPRRAGHH